MAKSGRYRYLALGFLIIASLLLGWMAHAYPRFPGDLPVTHALQTFQNRPFLAAMEGISYIIDNWKGTVVVVVAAFIFWRTLGALEGGMILLSGLFTGANELFKIIVNRPRPDAGMVQIFVVETAKSFPSGHAFFAVAVLGFVAYLMVTLQTKMRTKIVTVLAFVIWILLIGISRIYLGVHWASDVIGGYLVGGGFLVLEVWIYQRLNRKSKI